jgi:SAM-dependent methyltransferase
MDVTVQPDRCLLCGVTGRIRSAGFQQGYKQVGRDPLSLSWWECGACSGWFVNPVPTPIEIERHCNRCNYNDPAQAQAISQGKDLLHRRILSQLASWTRPGPLLDIGCSFGEFLLVAQEEGWTPSGFEPYGLAAKSAAQKGFDVRREWVLEKAGFPDKHFAAVTAIDSFCFTWDPYETLQLFFRLLQPGGVLTMRLTNKRVVLGLARALSRSGPDRDERLSRILKGQFHSIAIESLISILRGMGFDRIEVDSQAMTAPWRTLSASTRLAYGLARVGSLLSPYKVNFSPGVLLFAQKAP